MVNTYRPVTTDMADDISSVEANRLAWNCNVYITACRPLRVWLSELERRPYIPDDRLDHSR